GRVRLCDLHRRQHAHGLGDHAAADHLSAGAVRLRRCGGHCHGHAGGVLRAAAGDQPAAGMAGAAGGKSMKQHRPTHLTEPRWARGLLIAAALAFLALFVVLPLVTVFAQALGRGWALYFQAVTEPDAWAAIRLTLLVAAISLPLNL